MGNGQGKIVGIFIGSFLTVVSGLSIIVTLIGSQAKDEQWVFILMPIPLFIGILIIKASKE